MITCTEFSFVFNVVPASTRRTRMLCTPQTSSKQRSLSRDLVVVAGRSFICHIQASPAFILGASQHITGTPAYDNSIPEGVMTSRTEDCRDRRGTVPPCLASADVPGYVFKHGNCRGWLAGWLAGWFSSQCTQLGFVTIVGSLLQPNLLLLLLPPLLCCCVFVVIVCLSCCGVLVVGAHVIDSGDASNHRSVGDRAATAVCGC